MNTCIYLNIYTYINIHLNIYTYTKQHTVATLACVHASSHACAHASNLTPAYVGMWNHVPSELNSRMRACMCSAVSHSSHSAIHTSCRCVRQDSSTMSGFTWRVSHMHCIRISDTFVALPNKSWNFVHICGSEFKTPENGIRSARSVKPRASLVRTVCSTPPAASSQTSALTSLSNHKPYTLNPEP